MDSDWSGRVAVEKDEVVLRVTHGGRQEIVAKFYEIDAERKLNLVTFTKWNTEKGVPVGETYFTFRRDEVENLLTFLANIVTFISKARRKSIYRTQSCVLS
ncbi:MAG: hypothetical protein WDN02_05630 [Methylovirgula sp.]|uniref:hypothetical protein n=1 Tax=Methylovirgula sp. TaxID=1978224 RepID=UPI003075EFC7